MMSRLPGRNREWKLLCRRMSPVRVVRQLTGMTLLLSSDTVPISVELEQAQRHKEHEE